MAIYKSINELYRHYSEELLLLIDKIENERDYFNNLETPLEVFDYFISNHAKVRLYQYIINFAGSDNMLDDIQAIERKIQVAENFRDENGIEIKPAQTTENVIYFRFMTDYFLNNRLPFQQKMETSIYAIIYAQYILLYDFLKERIDEIYNANIFSKFHPDKKLDEVLYIIRKNQTVKGLSHHDIFRLLRHIGYICPYTLLLQILQKLSDEHYIYNVYGNNVLTFNGSVFNGYENETIENERRDRNEIARTLRLERATWLAGIAASFLVLIEILKNFHWVGSINLLTFFFVFLFGIGAGLIIYQIILSLLEKRE